MVNYKIGKIIKVTVTAIEPYGAFVLAEEGYTGLIHISEITGKFINNITDFVNVNDIINAKIIEVDKEKRQLKLTLKGINISKSTKKKKLNDTELGFELLEDLLPTWVDKKLKEIENKKKDKKN